tara:strand:- start:35 stop:175 length:141 start_codon:yes stop_codon:yes gene_type:complete
LSAVSKKTLDVFAKQLLPLNDIINSEEQDTSEKKKQRSKAKGRQKS